VDTYNWEEILKGKTSRELYSIYKGLSDLPDSVIPFAKKELENRHSNADHINETPIDRVYSFKPGCFVTIKKSFRYLFIAGLNLVILTIMLAIWTDSVEMTFNSIIRLWNLFILSCVSLFSLIGMRIMISVLRKQKNKSLKKRIVLSVVITVLISSFQYYKYTGKIIENRILNREIRQSIEEKINYQTPYLYVNNLTYIEYLEICKLRKFQKLPETSDGICLEIYEEPGPLGQDFRIKINFVVPISEKIEEFSGTDDHGCRRTQTFEIIDGEKHVEYNYVII